MSDLNKLIALTWGNTYVISKSSFETEQITVVHLCKVLTWHGEVQGLAYTTEKCGDDFICYMTEKEFRKIVLYKK